ncbi:probable peroxisomal acyl-coenzyme A oxidase 1 [Microplitis demolitor]|uniref:probable peroxisomal acyl-coenzyme A oxidase 1 n=1 Tax=Microplitis demolitor TaxID=69319 RepID=UPI000440026C|nr:probable peroxisomal acyl-coenzyme A oxidase 1 [Microplitis demolitor]XP_008552007.1 probable peroxisomal acyl-coenzyme A oxidase 1 [Microplitis demolitor]
MTEVNKDLQRERNNCTFKPIELTHLLDGSPEKTAVRREREEYFLSDPELKDKIPNSYCSHKELYEDAIRKGCILLRKIKYLQEQGKGEIEMYSQVLGGMLGAALIQNGNPLVLHYVMFIPTIMGQGTIEQQGYWISRAWSCNIIGTYAQTELGHGTFIRGLETTATYDPNTKEFILNSPTRTSYKWWPGGLGHTANYAVVVAQLYTQGICRGIHPFIVQLRDEETHEPLSGIKIGEIGTKLGMNSTNNGFLGFNEVRIPRENMLMKNAQVLEDGTYVKPATDKLTYGTMMFVRVLLVRDTARYLSKAVTIAIRYSAVRRQSQINPDAGECQIIDFVTQQYKLFPHLASCFSFVLSADWIWEMYNNVSAELHHGELERLPELHALTCCLKAVASSDAAMGVEQLRLACGGHGYMDSSNLPATYSLVTAICTYEGENTVMLLQTARYLVKACKQALAGDPLTPTVRYLSVLSKGGKRRPWKNTLTCIIVAHQAAAAGKIRTATDNIDKRIRMGESPEDAWNHTSIELVQAAEAHCRSFLVLRFAEWVKSLTNVSKELHEVLKQLCEMYAVYWVLQRLGDFLRFSCLKAEDVPALQKRLEDLFQLIRVNAVGLVDAFDIRDEILGSTLGAYDGNVYERLFTEAMKSPLNQESVNKSFHLYLKPLLKSNL